MGKFQMEELRDALRFTRTSVERKLYFLGWLNRKLGELDVTDFPVLVGGSAVAFYTAGNYATQDIDLCYSSPKLDSVLMPAGFRKDGRYWINEELDILVECPGSNRPERVFDVELKNGDHVYISSIEDMIADRLCALVFWNSPSDGEWAKLMLESDTDEFAIDWGYLEKRALAEGVDAALRKLKGDRDYAGRG
ncbi:MAG: UbiD family decarboxylase [Synergistaceae bacterium]|jgi:hypothetical protein|nr:UbiD family decarboxylase [Synergistaceae bacterium]